MDAQRDAVQSTLCSLGGQIEQMEATRDEHFRQISMLDVSLERVKMEHSRMKNLLTSISSLPNELLSTIFEAGYDPISLPSHPARAHEILVSQVTQHWRHVALNTPQLWNRVSLNASNFHHLDIAKMYLDRSKALPLDLAITLRLTAQFQCHITSITSLINPHFRRWRQFRVVGDWYSGVHRLIKSLPSTAPLLQCMDIRLGLEYDGETESHIPRLIFTGGSPSLTSIYLRGVTLQSCLPPVTALTTLQLHEPYKTVTAASVRCMFTGLAALTDLVINGEFYTDWSMVRIIELPALRRLRIYSPLGTDQIPGLLKAISAPFLQSLLLETLVGDEVDEFAIALTTSTAPKFPLLHSLTVRLIVGHDRPLTSPQWRLLMRAFPAVTDFTLSYDNMDFFLELLADSWPPESSPLWPELHTLKLLDQPGQISAELLGAAVSARIASGHPIRRIGLSKAILSMVEGELEWLRTHVEVEECALYPDVTGDDNLFGW